MRFASSNNEIRKKIEDYSYGLNDLIGKGFSSSVFKGVNERTRQQVAIKVIDLKSIKDRPAKQMLEGEIEALKKLNHINIMKCFDIYSTQNNCYIITEFCNEGDLQNLLKKRAKLPEAEAIPIFRDIVNGFKVIAEAGFLHRDLKLANILMKDKVAKIADFGFAKKITTNPKETTNVGSPLYMSPESLRHSIYTIKSQIWALGIILYELLHGRTPWEAANERELVDKMLKQAPTMSRDLSDDVKDFLRKCFLTDESKRLGLNQFYSHPFIHRITLEDGMPQLIRKQTSAPEPLKDPFLTKQPSVHAKLEKQKNQNQDTFQQQPSVQYHRPSTQQNKTQRQLTSQLNWMRFLYRFLQMFPTVEHSGRYTLGLRFMVRKSIMCVLNALKEAINRENVFNFDNWDEFLLNTEKCDKYKQILHDYTRKYDPIKKELMDEIGIIKKDKTITSVVDANFKRSESLLMYSINYALAQCSSLYNELKKIPEEKFGQQESSKLLRLDYTITFYQLSTFLLDNFYDMDYFARLAKIDLIVQHKPVQLQFCNFKDIEQKILALELLK